MQRLVRSALLAAATAAVAGPAFAADLTVTLKSATGQPVPNAVVSFRPSAGAPAPRPQGRYEMVQENIQFHPYVLIVPVGASVSFPNHDRVRHHVYSFSASKRFQLKLYGREAERTVLFDKLGVVAIGCNIHDAMSAFIDVVDTPFAVKTDARGEAVLSGLPAGAGTLSVWQPYLKTPGNEVKRPVSVAARGAHESLTLDLRPAAAMRM